MAAITGSSSLEPVFLQVGVGDAVLVEPHEGGWWVGQVCLLYTSDAADE